MAVELSHAEKVKKKLGKDTASIDSKIMEYQKKYERQAEKKVQVEVMCISCQSCFLLDSQVSHQ